MPLIAILARMELNGFGFSTEQCEKLKQTLLRKANNIEAKARELAGRPFSMNSPEDIAQLLYIELGLPSNGDPNAPITPKRGRQARRTRHLSTAKGMPNSFTYASFTIVRFLAVRWHITCITLFYLGTTLSLV